MMFTGVISSHHPGFILFGRHESPASAWLSNKSNCQINNRRVSDLFPSQLLARLCRTSFCYYSSVKGATTKRNYYRESVSKDGFDQLPFWSALIKDPARNIRSLFLFLVEQPSQLKFIEWPSFESTLKTATLTLVLVALLIISLASVDSCLCYILAFIIRKSA